MSAKPKGIIIDPNTGLVTGEVYEGDKILRKASVSYLSDTQVWNIDSFFKGHTGELLEWVSELSTNEKAFLFSIVPYIGYEDCCLKRYNRNVMGTEDLVQVSGMSRSAVYEVIDSLIKKDILYKGKNSKERQFFINPWLFAKGNRINKVLKTMFQNYRIRVMGGVKWKNVSIEDEA